MTYTADSKIDFLQKDIYTGLIKPVGYSTAQLNSIPNPKIGWLAEDSTRNALVRWDGSDWVLVTPEAGQDYETLIYTLQDLLTALENGKTNLVILGSFDMPIHFIFTEPSYYIKLYGALNFLDDQQIIFEGDTQNVSIIGTGPISNFTYHNTFPIPLISGDVSGDRIYLENLRIINTSDSDSTKFCDNAKVFANNVNYSGGGGLDSSLSLVSSNCFISDSIITGNIVITGDSVTYSSCNFINGSVHVESVGAKLIGCEFSSSDIVLGSSSNSFLVGCTTGGSSTFTDGGSSHRSGNNTVIGNDYD